MDKKIVHKLPSFWKPFADLFRKIQQKLKSTSILQYLPQQSYFYLALLLIPIIVLIVLLQKIIPEFKKRRAKQMVKLVWDILPTNVRQEDHKVLDLGSGDGYIAELLSQKGLNLTKIDIEDYNEIGEKVIVYDGKTIPFSDNSFDTTMVNFILHHTDDPEAILREVIRVSTKYIIIAEDIVDSWFDKYLGLLHAVTYDGIPCKNNFYDSEKWATIFKNLELEIVASKNISRWTWPIYPIHRRIYLLRV